MSTQTVINCILIFTGAIIMLVSIVKAKGVLSAMPFVPEHHRQHIEVFLKLHRALMVFFLLGYIVVLIAYLFDFSLASETFVSIIFLFGAIFVLMGIVVQSRLLSEIQTTLRGLLPICAYCKKIRVTDENPEDSKSWKRIETYIGKKADVDFSHGICPDCYQEQENKI